MSAPAAAPGEYEWLTVLCSRERRLAKTIHADGRVEGYDAARTFDLHAVPVPNLEGLRRLLEYLAPHWHCAVVRGGIADPQRVQRVRRLLHDDCGTGERATLCEAPRRWLALDFDDIPCPAGVDVRDLPACGRAAIALLPPQFTRARCIVQATSQHAIKQGLRLRVWFWGSRPAGSAELRVWLRGAPVDHAIFNPAQLVYTARPIFLGGSDPLPRRLAELPGAEVVRVPSPGTLAPPPRRPRPPPPRFTNSADATAYARQHLKAAAQEILNAGEGGRHRALVRVAARLGPLIHAQVIAEPAARTVLARAAEATGLESQEIEGAIGWGLSRPPQAPPFGTIQNG